MKNSFQVIKQPRKNEGFTKKQLLELAECVKDPVYFCRNHMMIKTPAQGTIKFDMYNYQEKFMQTIMDHRFVCALMPRQSGKTEAVVGYILWRAMYRKDQTILILANKREQALEIMKRIKHAYENVPDHVRAGAYSYNKSEIYFDTGSSIMARATTADAARGLSISIAIR